MSDPIAPRAVETAVTAAIRRAADATGVDFGLLVETARRESALNPLARAGTSSATGLFQFIESTWIDMVRRHGGAHGLGQYAAKLQGGQLSSADRREVLALRNDAELSARLAGELARENAAFLEARLGRAPAAGELYAAHVMGAGGAVRLIEAAQAGAPSAAALFPREASANRGLFFAASGEARSAQGLLDRLGVEANASFTEPGGAAAPSGPLSPGLAHVLFAMALLPLLRGSEDEASRDPLAAMLAYKRLDGI